MFTKPQNIDTFRRCVDAAYMTISPVPGTPLPEQLHHQPPQPLVRRVAVQALGPALAHDEVRQVQRGWQLAQRLVRGTRASRSVAVTMAGSTRKFCTRSTMREARPRATSACSTTL